jgi:hypothetical protein
MALEALVTPGEMDDAPDVTRGLGEGHPRVCHYVFERCVPPKNGTSLCRPCSGDIR